MKIKDKIKNMSLNGKLVFYFLLFSAVMLVVIWLFQVVFLEQFYKEVKVSQVKRAATVINKNIDSEDLANVLGSISQENEVCIEIIYTSTTTTYYSVEYPRECIIHSMSAFDKMRLIARTVEQGGELMDYYSMQRPTQGGGVPSGTGQESIIYSKAATLSDGNQVVVLIDSVITPVEATVSTLRRQIVIITLVMVALSIGLAFLISRRIAKPIEKINDEAKELAKQNYDVEFSQGGYKEINELTGTLNQTAKELGKVESLRRELIANVSHDLRTPLTLIQGYAEAMRDLPNEYNEKNADIIIGEAKRLTSLVNDMLSLSKMQANAETFDFETFSLTKMTAEIVERVGALTKKDGYTIAFDFAEEVFVLGDRTKLMQCVYNLLINAVNYTGEDKRVDVLQEVSDGKVTIGVSDSGEGVSKEALPYIWDRYYKSDKTHKRAVTGSGIGLSIVKAVVSAHGGSYGVSDRVPHGSTFFITLNVKSDAESVGDTDSGKTE